jgi:hypothetical protein
MADDEKPSVEQQVDALLVASTPDHLFRALEVAAKTEHEAVGVMTCGLAYLALSNRNIPLACNLLLFGHALLDEAIGEWVPPFAGLDTRPDMPDAANDVVRPIKPRPL